MARLTTNDSLNDRLREAMDLWGKGWGRNDISKALKIGHSTIDREVKRTKTEVDIRRHKQLNTLRREYNKQEAQAKGIKPSKQHKASLAGLRFRYLPQSFKTSIEREEKIGSDELIELFDFGSSDYELEEEKTHTPVRNKKRRTKKK
jgi:IS30 family transposase